VLKQLEKKTQLCFFTAFKDVIGIFRGSGKRKLSKKDNKHRFGIFENKFIVNL